MRARSKAAIVVVVVAIATVALFLVPVFYFGQYNTPTSSTPEYRSLTCWIFGFGFLAAPDVLIFGCRDGIK